MMDGLQRDRELIQGLVSHAGLTPAAVAKAAGVAVTTVNRPYNGSATTRLGRSVLEKLHSTFPDFEGWADYGYSVGQPVPSVVTRKPNADPGDVVEIDEIDLTYGLGATYIDTHVDAQKRVFSRSWLRNFTRSAPENLFWTIGDGDSMEPTIRSGEMILIDAGQRTVRVSEGIWAVAIGQIGMVKRIHVPGPGRVQLISDNGRIPPAEVADDELHIVGRVVAVVRRL